MLLVGFFFCLFFLPVAAVSSILLPRAPSCAALEMRSEARLRSHTPTFDLSFADSQRSKR